MPSLKTRQRIAFVWLLVSILAAGYSAAIGDSDAGGVKDDTLPGWLEFLVEAEFAHIVVHLMIFGLVAMLLGPWGDGSRRLAWLYVCAGAIVMEAVQFLVGQHDSLPSLIWGIVFDFMVDGVGGWLGLWLVWRFYGYREYELQ